MADRKEAGMDDDAELSRILAMSEDDLRAEITSEGRDPDQVVAGMRRELSAMIELVRERDRLRDALQRIADQDIRYPPHDPGDYLPPKGTDGACRKIALAALAGEPPHA